MRSFEPFFLGLKHLWNRGPDDRGSWSDPEKRVWLGHSRLAIVDLSTNASQPMIDDDCQSIIIFNGEIYNHSDLRRQLVSLGFHFFSNSDSEVILKSYHKWGASCLSRFEGMFSFALLDRRNQKIFFARDRAGEKPFYYMHTGEQIRFGSELKALLTDSTIPRELNWNAFDQYLAYGYVSAPDCILDGFRKLEPGCAMYFDLATGALSHWRYWDLPDADYSHPLSTEEIVDELDRLLSHSVRQQLVADVPLGLLLSGGVDSSIVTALACEQGNILNTYTIGFSDDNQLDETRHARLISDYFGTRHMELMADEIDPSMVIALAKHIDEPIVDSSILPTYLVSQLVRNHCTVALGGDGGDELFGGYWHYSRMAQQQESFGSIPRAIRRLGAISAKKFLSLGTRGRDFIARLDYDFDQELSIHPNYFDSGSRDKILGRFGVVNVDAEVDRAAKIPRSEHLLDRAMRFDFKHYLPEDILVKVDRSSMLASLEVRSPFLNHQLIEFSFKNIPPNLKASSVSRKVVLKQLCQRKLPASFDYHRKQGFSIPLHRWLSGGPFRAMAEDYLLTPNSVFVRSEVEKMFLSIDRGKTNCERVFSLLIFEIWRREYNVKFQN